MSKTKGYFTIPGEAGYEDLTFSLAEKWGADVIRDSDGTKLSPEILQGGYGIYSTICPIRDHNPWIKEHPNARQQCFLITEPKVAVAGEELTIPLLADYDPEQFEIDDRKEALARMQVMDRTTGEQVPETGFEYNKEDQTVTLVGADDWHEYTVSFLVFRIWEEISMYNHRTNHWDTEHLAQLDPRDQDAQEFLLQWMKDWCEEHPDTNVVRFTSLFYNFVWIFGSDERLGTRFTDWGSYDFTVSLTALKEFEEEKGYALTAEDFVNEGKFHVSHMPNNEKKKDWMDFVNRFVVSFGRKLVDIVHSYGKEAYLFYDDSWVGTEPYGERFPELGFDGIIKCVFSGFECRLCAGVPVKTHEIRMHPYLFQEGLGGAPTFAEGGNPAKDAMDYWLHIRRALLREKIDRTGLGGYLHLTEDYPDFVDTIEQITDDFRSIRSLYDSGMPAVLPVRVGVLTSWGKLRSWTLSGHFHETDSHDLIHINESLSGLPFSVSFFNFDEVKHGALKNVDVIINAGFMGSAWSGGDAWTDKTLIETLTRWVYEGGIFLGVREPSAAAYGPRTFRMAQVLGIDEDLGDRVCHGRMTFKKEAPDGLFPEGSLVRKSGKNLYLTDETTKVFAAEGNDPTVTEHPFGKGLGIYLASFTYSTENTRMLLNLIMRAAHLTGVCETDTLMTDSASTECAFFPDAGKLVLINQTEKETPCQVKVPSGKEVSANLLPYEMQILEIT